MLQGEDLEECMRTANALAALKCRQLGGRAALPDQKELREFLSEPPAVAGD
jgi:sugar/nucleoside kinase (ribokinase family)